ncbi:MAG: glycoside hydrolase family 9 protein [Planctomycetota bacterium]
MRVVVTVCTLLCMSAFALSASEHNYIEMLQKGLYFYECQEAGVLSPGNRVPWRGPSCLEDGAEVGLDLAGGWYDAGDHWKANGTMAQAGSFLAWSVITFPDVYQDNDQLPHALNSLRHIVDYFQRCIADPQPGEAEDFSGYEVFVDVGGKTTPTAPEPGVHKVWCAPEAIDGYTVREPLKVNATVPNGGVCAAMAGTLASAAQVFHLYGTDDDRALASTLMPIAEKLTAFARAYPESTEEAIRPNGQTVQGGYLDDWGWDDLIWARIWLHRAHKAMATDGYTDAHIADARNILDQLDDDGELYKITSWWKESSYNHASMLAWLQTDHTQAETDLFEPKLDHLFTLWNEANPDASPDTSKFYHTPYGLKYRQVYGSAFVGHRVFRNTALAAMYAHWTDDQTTADTFATYVREQTDYYLGDNKQGMSYLIGYGDNGWPDPLHHRGAHGCWAGNLNKISSDPLHMPSMVHVLYGGLIGGPDGNDDFTDGTFDHYTTEPIIGAAGEVQIVAAFLGALNGADDDPVADFPPAPARDLSLDPEWTDRDIYVAARTTATGGDALRVEATLYNRSRWPARVLADGSFRYYFTADAGETDAGAFDLAVDSSQGGEAGGIVHVGGDLFYAAVAFPDERLLPDYRDGVRCYRRDATFTITAASGTFDSANDWSAVGLDADRQVVPHIPVYQGENLIPDPAPWGDRHQRRIHLQVTPVTACGDCDLIADPAATVEALQPGWWRVLTDPTSDRSLSFLFGGNG